MNGGLTNSRWHWGSHATSHDKHTTSHNKTTTDTYARKHVNSDAPDDDESDDENAEVTALCEGVDWSDEEFDVEPDNDSFLCPICRSTYPREELLAAHSLYHT